MRFSKKTPSLLIQLIQASYGTHNDLDLLIQEFELQEEFQSQLTKNEKARKFVESLEKHVEDHPLSEKRIIELIERGIGRFQNASEYHADTYARFCKSLLLDGFVVDHDLKLLPHTPEPASLAPQLSKLEENLNHHGFSIALTHFQQAYRNFTDGHFESSHGQIRSFIENLIPEICKKITGKEFLNNPPAALKNLQQNSKIDHNEGGIFKNFWSHIQDGGPTKGLRQRAMLSIDYTCLLQLHDF